MTQGLPGGGAGLAALAGRGGFVGAAPAAQQPMGMMGIPQQQALAGMQAIAARQAQPQSYPAVQRLSAMAGPPQIHGMYQPPQAGAAVRAFPGMMPTYHAPAPMPPMGMLQRPQLSGVPLQSAASINPALLYNPIPTRVTPQTAQPALPTAQGINPAQLYGVGPSLGSLRAGVGGPTLSDARQKRKLSLREILGR